MTPLPELDLKEGTLHLWRAALTLDAAQVAELQPLLSADELERASRLKLPQIRDAFVVGRALLRAILSRYVALPPKDLRFRYGDHGKPEWYRTSSREPIRFNVSHSGGLAVYALTRAHEVGIDVEALGRRVEGSRIAARYFTPREAAALHALPEPEREAAFLRAWTRKEAYIKARGKGLAIPLNKFEIAVDPQGPARLLGAEGEVGDPNRWFFTDLEVGPGYVAAAAVEGPVDAIVYRQWD